jgi:protein-S-isoprenylcysteine O-methyltransferase Ste14
MEAHHNQPHQSTFGRYFQPHKAAWWDSVLLGFLLVAMCSQLNIGDIGQDTTAQGYVTKQLKIALPDIALILSFGWFFVRTTIVRAWKRLWWPPLPCWALMFTMVIALIHSDSIWTKAGESIAQAPDTAAWKTVLKDRGTFQSIKEAIAETIQYGLYFLVAPWLFVNLLHDRRKEMFIDRRRFALGAFMAATLLAVGIATLQVMAKPGSAPQAWFGSPNAFAGWVALAFPLCICLAIWQFRTAPASLRWPALAILGALAISLGFLIASPWPVLAVLLGLAVTAARQPQRMRVSTALILLVPLFTLMLWPRTGTSPRAEFAQVGSSEQKVKKQYIEWYAAAGWGLPRQKAFATGVGPGNYQLNIGPYYASLPNEEKMPPDSNNLYLVQAVSVGVLGLSALLWIIFHFGRLAWSAQRVNPSDWLGAGVLASLVSWLVVNNFHALIVRGSGVVLAFVLSLAVIAAQLNRGDQSTLEQ